MRKYSILIVYIYTLSQKQEEAAMAMEKILVVDDEPNICEVLRTILVK